MIKEISLINPEVVWAQNADGKWRVPSTPQELAMPVLRQTSRPTTEAGADMTAHDDEQARGNGVRERLGKRDAG